MAQLFSAFGLDVRLLLIQALNFGIVLLVLRHFVYRPVLEVLEKRRATVAKGVEEAEKASELLASADQTALGRVNAAEKEAETIIASARQAGGKEEARIVSEAEARAVSITESAELRAKETAARVSRESEEEVARLAVLAAEKILKKHYD